IARRDVLEHYLEAREALQRRPQLFLEEDLLPVEYIDRRIGGFSMHQQRQADLLHLLERMKAARQPSDAFVRMRGRSGGIELHAEYPARQLGARDLLGR